MLTMKLARGPGRATPVAELWAGRTRWGEMYHTDGHVRLMILPATAPEAWDFRLREVVRLLEESERRLLERLLEERHKDS